MTIYGRRGGSWYLMNRHSLVIWWGSLFLFGCSETKGRAASIDISLAQPISIDAAMQRLEELVSHFNCEPWGSSKLQSALGAAQWECKPVHPKKTGRFSMRFSPYKKSASDEPSLRNFTLTLLNDTNFKTKQWTLYLDLHTKHLPVVFPDAVLIAPLDRLATATQVTDLVELSETHGFALSRRELKRIDCYNADNYWLFWRRIDAAGSAGTCKRRRR